MQGLSPCLLHWQEGSLLLGHLESPGEALWEIPNNHRFLGPQMAIGMFRKPLAVLSLLCPGSVPGLGSGQDVESQC